MSKNHGARQQKRVAKQKAKRAAKRSLLSQRTTKDPTIRLQRAATWPVVEAQVGASIWDQGIGHVAIARQASEGQLVFGIFLVDVYCLGVKNAYWREGTRQDFQGMIEQMNASQKMRAIAPACLVKIVKGAVDYARSFGFTPHPDYRHASILLEGIDPSTCPEEFTYGRDGKPFYMRGPNESVTEAKAITLRVQEAGGDFVFMTPGSTHLRELPAIEDEFDQLDSPDEDDSDDELL
jgi:hypothetical protein